MLSCIPYSCPVNCDWFKTRWGCFVKKREPILSPFVCSPYLFINIKPLLRTFIYILQWPLRWGNLFERQEKKKDYTHSGIRGAFMKFIGKVIQYCKCIWTHTLSLLLCLLSSRVQMDQVWGEGGEGRRALEQASCGHPLLAQLDGTQNVHREGHHHAGPGGLHTATGCR